MSPTSKSRFIADSEQNAVGIVAVGFAGGQPKAGVDNGPRQILDAGLVKQLEDDLEYKVHFSNTVHTYQDELDKAKSLDCKPESNRGMLNAPGVSAVCNAISQQVYEHASKGRLALTLGGDHSIAIGTVSATAKAIRSRLDREIALIWVDAHADINTPECSDSGNIHGMPVAFLAGLASAHEKSQPFGWLEDQNRVKPSKIVYIGLRSVDIPEKKILRENNIKAFSMHDIDRHGIGRIMEMALGHIGADTPIHLSFDVDAIDPMWAPSTGTPVRGGLTLREGDYIAEAVAMTGNLIALDLVEVNPALDTAGADETIRAACSIVRCALGDTLL